MSSALIASFQYEALPAETAKELRKTAKSIRNQVRATSTAILTIGRALVSVKEQLEHGQFVQWVQIECGFTIRSAQNYMSVATFAAKRLRF